jgi:hypothetical protein
MTDAFEPHTPPIPIEAGSVGVSEDGFGVVLSIELRLGTNEALDLCFRVIKAVARVKQTPGAAGMTTQIEMVRADLAGYE